MSGRTHRAVKKPNGNYDIHDVEVFAAGDVKGHKFDPDWLDKAIQKNQARKAEGYLPPLHVHHHSLFNADPVEPAGKFELVKREKGTYDGQEVDILFANYLDVPASTYDRMKKGELVHRSVEICDPAKPEIDSIALLDHEVPYFRFKLLSPQEDPSTPVAPVVMCQASSSTLSGVADATAKKGVEVVLKFAHGQMKEEQPSSKKVQTSGQPKQQNQDQPPQHQGGGDTHATITSLLDIAMKLHAGLALLQNQLGGAKPQDGNMSDQSGGNVGGGPVQMSVAPASAPDVAVAAGTIQGVVATIDAESIKLRAENQALKAKLDQQTSREKCKVALDVAKAELVKFGLNAEATKELEQLVEKHGEGVIEVYMSAVKRFGVADEAPDAAGGDRPAADRTHLPENLKAFAGESDENKTKVLQFSAMYDRAPRSLQIQYNREAFIRAQLTPVQGR